MPARSVNVPNGFLIERFVENLASRLHEHPYHFLFGSIDRAGLTIKVMHALRAEAVELGQYRVHLIGCLSCVGHMDPSFPHLGGQRSIQYQRLVFL